MSNYGAGGMKKIILKVLNEDSWEWVHFCYIPAQIYDEFFKTTGCEKSEFGTFLSVWAKGDFGLKTSVSTLDEVKGLRYAINKKYLQEYAELYALSDTENPRIYGWVRMWVSQHMRVEIAARKDFTDE